MRLRWVAVCGQLAAILSARFVFHLEIQWFAMFAGLMLTVFSNHLAFDAGDRDPDKVRKRANRLVFIDSLILTGMLYFSGGVHNPFVVFHLLLVALAAMVMTGRSLSLLLVLVAVEVALITAFHIPFHGPAWVVNDGRLTYPVFVAGWGISLVMIALCIAFFMYRINRQLRERELALAQAERQVVEANRFQSLATLAAGVAHELGSPLGTIAIASKDLERSLQRDGASAQWQEDARLIRSEVDRCRQILDRLDRRSTQQTGEAPEACTAAQLSLRLREHLKAVDFTRLKIEDRTQDFPLVVSINAVRQALIVLIENACEADRSGEPVILDIRIEDGNAMVFRVLDSGPGIPDQLRSRIGQPFFSTKKNQSGMGLGIFLVQTLAEQLGGSCTLLPAANGGTCATLKLPVKPELE